MARAEQVCFECEAVLKTRREKEEGLCHVCESSETLNRKTKEFERRKDKGKREKQMDDD